MNGTAIRSEPPPRAARQTAPPIRPMVSGTSLTTSAGARSRSRNVRPRSSKGFGGRRGATASLGSPGGPSGERSKSWPSRLAPVIPSTVAWCIFTKSATRLSGSPSTSSISHSGRSRRSWVLQNSPANSASWRSSPGGSSTMRRRWRSTRRSGSSVQYGRPRFRGTVDRRWRIGAIPGKRASSMAVMRSNGSPGPMVAVSRMSSPQTCICIVGVSHDRNIASRPPNCSMFRDHHPSDAPRSCL